MDAPAPAQMNIKVRGTDGTELFFRLKPTTKLKKMMEVFLQKQGANENSCRFVYDGARVRHDDTPKGLNMEDGDVIEAVVEQSGGASLLARTELLLTCSSEATQVWCDQIFSTLWPSIVNDHILSLSTTPWSLFLEGLYPVLSNL